MSQLDRSSAQTATKGISAMLRSLAMRSLLVLVVVGLTPYRPTRVAAAEASPDLRYVSGLAALERYTSTHDCVGTDAKSIEHSIDQIEISVSAYNQFVDLLRRMNVTQAELNEPEQFVREEINKHTSLAFNYATQAIKNGCINQSDRICRRLLEFYIGPAYAGIRDRAIVCIEDVRAAR
jgi:hypothetical protein